MAKALLVIDVQNDYFCGGNMELVEMEKALVQTNKLITYARENHHKIYFIQHIATKEGASFFIPNTKGVALNNGLERSDETVIIKHYPNSFRETGLDEVLKKEQITELMICGAMSHMCIDSTVRAGFDLGYKITLFSDACATRDLEFQGEVIPAQQVHNTFMSALGSLFCEVLEVGDIS
jgi:nicotinamidase-related amidase